MNHDQKTSNMVAEALRVSHCENEEKKHECVGVCTITRLGVKLDCTLCGSADIGLDKDPRYEKLSKILDVLSIDIDLIHRNQVIQMMEKL